MNPIDRVTLTPGLGRTARAAAPSTEPKDEVRLGERPAETPTAGERSLQRMARQADFREMYRLHGVLADEKTPPERFSQAAYALSKRTAACSDTLLRKLGESVLSEYVHLDDPAAKSALVKGPVRGPSEFLAYLERQIEPYCTYYVPEKSVIPYLQHLYAGVKGEPVPEGALRAVSHLACRFLERSAYELAPSIREKESAEDDRRYAGACGSLVEQWWNSGQIEVRRDGQRVLPGALDLLETVATRRVAVRGNRIELVTPRPADPEVEALLKGVSPWDQEPIAGAVEALRKRPDLAAGLAASADPLRGEGDFARVGRLLEACREPFRPHLEELRGLTASAAALGTLRTGPRAAEGLLQFYDRLLKAFPEAADERMARETLAPLCAAGELQSDHSMRQVVKALWDRHPDLVQPLIEEMVAQCEGRLLTGNQVSLMGEAARRGWKPRPEHLAGLAALLVPAPSRDPVSVFSGYVSSDDFRSTMKLLGTLEPRLQEALELPNHRGELVPLKEAILDRLLSDAKGDLHNLVKDGWRTSEVAYAWIFPDSRLGDSLLERLESGLAGAGSLDGLPRDGQQAAAVLSQAKLTPEQEDRLGRALAPCLSQRQGHYVLQDLVARFRRPEVERLVARGTFDSCMRALELTLAGGHGDPFETDRVLKPLWAAADAGALPRLREAAAEVLARRGSLKEMTLAETAQVEALASQAGLGDVLGPALLADHGYPTKRIYEAVQQARLAEVERVQQSLHAGGLKPAERTGMLGRSRDLSAVLKSGEEELEAATQEAWKAGVLASGSGAWLEGLPVGKACALYESLAPRTASEAAMAEEFARFGEVLGKLGVDHFDEAAEAWREVERQVADGVPREAAVRKALVRYLGGSESAPDEPAREILLGEAAVQVGGISLPVTARRE